MSQVGGEKVGLSLGRALLKEAIRVRLRTPGEDGDESDEDEEQSVSSFGRDRNGNYDCVLIASGRTLAAHRVVLARRSPVFRDMIAEEERPGTPGPLELLVPDLRCVVRARVGLG